jgi:hypothetical protein
MKCWNVRTDPVTLCSWGTVLNGGGTHISATKCTVRVFFKECLATFISCSHIQNYILRKDLHIS